MSPLADADRRRSAAYVRGLLAQDELERFEARLAVEPELAKHVAASAASGELLRALETSSDDALARSRRLRPWMWAASLAVGLLLLGAVAAHVLAAR